MSLTQLCCILGLKISVIKGWSKSSSALGLHNESKWRQALTMSEALQIASRDCGSGGTCVAAHINQWAGNHSLLLLEWICFSLSVLSRLDTISLLQPIPIALKICIQQSIQTIYWSRNLLLYEHLPFLYQILRLKHIVCFYSMWIPVCLMWRTL